MRTTRYILVALIVSLLLVLLPAIGAARMSPSAAPPTPSLAPRPLVIAHRGASGQAPENTMAAFELAIELGSDMIELDVRRCLDGALVVIHDATVDRTTRGDYRGAVAGLTLAQLKSLDAGSWRGQQFAGERIPTLEEVLAAFGGRTRILIELKEAGTEADIAHAVRAASVADSVMMQSFDAECVNTIASLMPEAPAGVLFNAPGLLSRLFFASTVVNRTVGARGAFAAVNYNAVTQSLAGAVRAAGLGIYAWTVDDASAMHDMVKLGLDGIITNYPETLRGLL